MYFPYLFGNRAELLALRTLGEAQGLQNVVPLVDPVKEAPADLVRCIESMGKSKNDLILIANPAQGDFKNGISQEWAKPVAAATKTHKNVILGYACRPHTTINNVDSFMRRHSDARIALIYMSPSFSAAEVASLAASNISFHICLRNKLPSAHRQLLPKAKVVDIGDFFNKQARNADYEGSELFSDAYKSYSTSAFGFGDYTVIGSIYQPGGGKPAAVVVHLTYKHPNTGDLWIEHFVSDDTDMNVGDVASKYLQAVKKAVKAVNSRTAEFGTDTAIEAYRQDAKVSHFAGLPKNKELQIRHHIARVNSVLT